MTSPKHPQQTQQRPCSIQPCPKPRGVSIGIEPICLNEETVFDSRIQTFSKTTFKLIDREAVYDKQLCHGLLRKSHCITQPYKS
mmetsp:Transcript_62304/g.72873  ORF Transcript_62304/g.72873 Transcript_62304/m.72873 type:complete len:84 (+) Transcript_62304:39-290(+)